MRQKAVLKRDGSVVKKEFRGSVQVEEVCDRRRRGSVVKEDLFLDSDADARGGGQDKQAEGRALTVGWLSGNQRRTIGDRRKLARGNIEHKGSTVGHQAALEALEQGTRKACTAADTDHYRQYSH